MTSIAALAPVPRTPDQPPAPRGGGDFAPVLAARLAPPSVRAAPPGNPLPPPGKELPAAGDAVPDAMPATNDPAVDRSAERKPAGQVARHRGLRPPEQCQEAEPPNELGNVPVTPTTAEQVALAVDPTMTPLPTAPSTPMPPLEPPVATAVDTPPIKGGAAPTPFDARSVGPDDATTAGDPFAPVLPAIQAALSPAAMPAGVAPPITPGRLEAQHAGRTMLEAWMDHPGDAPDTSELLPATGTVRPAAELFGAALHRAASAERRPVAVAIDLPAPIVVTLAPAPQGADPAPPLDLTQARWPEAMMARIEHIRDAQNAGDTRIRLHPDALGHIDVALRREGEAVHVRFAAADPATARLLTEAQPRLAELAEARGLKLAQPTLDAGTGNAGGERRQPATPSAMPSLRAERPLDAEPTADIRLA